MTKFTTLLVAATALTMGAACGPASDGGVGEGSGEGAVGTSEEALAPAGSNAKLVGTAFPSVMYPGERRVVSVTLKNTGAASPANDWTVTPQYALGSLNNNVDWHYAYVGNTVAAGSNTTFSFVVTAPPASAPFAARMVAVGGGAFGDTVTVPITVDPTTTPQWGCTLVSSTLPSQLSPGENRSVTFTVRNTGSATWPATGLKLVTRDVPANLWGATGADLTTAVAPGGTATFAFALKAPATPGTYALQRDMKDYAGIGDFRRYGLCVTSNVVVGGMKPLDAAIVSQDFATTLRPGQQELVHVVMQNTGSLAWPADGATMLYSLNTPVNGWGRTQSAVGAATASGSNVGFGLVLTAPAAPGTYHQRWQMRRTTGTNAGFFGPIIDVPVTIPVLQTLDAALVSQNFPTEAVIGEAKTVTVVMKNTGVEAWSTGGSYVLASPDSGSSGYLTTATAGGADGTLSVYFNAPQTAGTYHQHWQMKKTSGTGAGFFGAVIDVPITVKLPDAPALNATVAQQNFPARALAGQPINVNIVMRNTGSETWAGDGTYELHSMSTPEDAFGPTRFPSAGAPYQGWSYFTLNLTAPSTPGTYHQRWQMKKTSGPGAGSFGEIIDVPLTVWTPAPGNHTLLLTTGICAGSGVDSSAYVSLFGHEDPGSFNGYLQTSCASGTTCAYEIYPGEEFEIWCYEPGHTYNPRGSSEPSTWGNGYRACDFYYNPEGVVHCDVFDTSQSYAVSVGWESNPCFPDTCF